MGVSQLSSHAINSVVLSYYMKKDWMQLFNMIYEILTQTEPYFKGVTKWGTNQVLQYVLLGYRKENNHSLQCFQQTHQRIDQDLRSQKNENYQTSAIRKNETN